MIWYCPCCGEWKDAGSTDLFGRVISPGTFVDVVCSDCDTEFRITFEFKEQG